MTTYRDATLDEAVEMAQDRWFTDTTQFRESLKSCIENLGVIASKKMDYVTNYALTYLQRDFFHTYVSQKIKKAYKTILLARLMTICQISCERQTFSSIQRYIKLNQREK